MNRLTLALALHLATSFPAIAALNCDMSAYREQEGLRADLNGDTLAVDWAGERGTMLRLDFGIENASPVIRRMAVGNADWSWKTVATNLQPEFLVTSGVRRISQQQITPMREAG